MIDNPELYNKVKKFIINPLLGTNTKCVVDAVPINSILLLRSTTKCYEVLRSATKCQDK